MQNVDRMFRRVRIGRDYVLLDYLSLSLALSLSLSFSSVRPRFLACESFV